MALTAENKNEKVVVKNLTDQKKSKVIATNMISGNPATNKGMPSESVMWLEI